MHIEYHKWHSESIGHDMELKVYGHYGMPIIAFPSSSGRFYDFEGFGMVDCVAPFIEEGKVRIIAIDGIDQESWDNFGILPGDRNARHEAYDRHVVHEVIPFVKERCPNSKILCTGCSMGAYHSLNFYLKHPELVNGVIALSGLYRLDWPQFQIKDYDIPYVYFNSPLNYLAGLTDENILKRYREGRIIVCVGQGNWETEMIQDTRALQAIFEAKKIPAWVDFWGHDVDHHWHWWRKQFPYFVGHVVG